MTAITRTITNPLVRQEATGGGAGDFDASEVRITVPATNIDSDLTDFPLVIESAHCCIPENWFDLADSSTISLHIEGGAEVHSQVAYFDQAARVLRLHAKVTLSSSVDNVYLLKADTAPTLTDNPFSAYELVVPVGYATDVDDITDFSDNDYSGSGNWTVTASGAHPVYNGAGDGLGLRANDIHTDSISIASDLYLVADGMYGSIGTYTLAGLSDGTGTMDGVMLRNFTTYGIIASYSDGAGGWLETDNTSNAAERGVGERFVASLSYESGVERHVWRDGIGKATDGTVQNPFPTKTRCTIGTRDGLTEDLLGVVYEVRAASFIPTDAWAKAEALNMGNRGFYEVEILGGAAGDIGIATSVSFTIPASDVSADLTDFPLVIEHGRHINFPREVWGSSSGLINVAINGGADLETEVAVFDATREKLRIHVKTDLSSSVDNDFLITWNRAPTVTGTVFDAYALAVSFYGMYAGQDDTDIVNYSGDATTFTAKENTAPNPIFREDAFWSGDAFNRIAFTLASPIAGTTMYMASHGLSNVSTANYFLGFEEQGGGLEMDLGINATASDVITGFFATRTGGNFLSSTDSATLLAEEITLQGTTEFNVSKQVWFNGANKNTLAGWWMDAGNHDQGYIASRATPTETLWGYVRDVRIADFIPSDAWVEFEALNMQGAPVDYTVAVPGTCPAELEGAYVVANAFSDYVTDTDVTITIPTEAEEGDLLVLIGFLRAARTDPATGWTEHVDRIETGTGEVDQRLQVLSKRFDGVETDVTYGSASSLRMGACLVVIRNAGTIQDITESDINYRGSDALAYTLPEVTNSGEDTRLCIQAYTSSYTENSNSATTTVSTIGGGDVINLHNTLGTYGGAANSWARLGAIAFDVEASASYTVTLPYCAIEDRAAPVIPHCYFFVSNAG